MTILNKLKESISRYTTKNESGYFFNTEKEILNVANQVIERRDINNYVLNKINFKFDVSGRIYCGYDKKMKPSTSICICDNSLEVLLFTNILFVEYYCKSLPYSLMIKQINLIFKISDRLEHIDLSDLDVINELINSPLKKVTYQNKSYYGMSRVKIKNHKILDLTVLFYEGPIARAYLEVLKSLGYRPKKIIELVSQYDLITKKPVGRCLPKFFRTNYSSYKQRKQIHYWAQNYLKKSTKTISGILTELEINWGVTEDLVKGANKNFPLSFYSDCVESVLISDLKDPNLLDMLNIEKAGHFLFTGGGIVPSEMLSINGVKLLHVHPGYLPYLRGADCALWSQLMHDRMSASVFYMSEGIDTGDLIASYWLPSVRFENLDSIKDTKSLYRLIYAFVDPWVRAFSLREFVNSIDGNLSKVTSYQQDHSRGITFHFMHEEIKSKVLERLFIPKV
ncbi:hypothetical protein [Vibrio hepatarius]|uniref:hypothetical protein n=1 Tax=Vibrio hepatarius TaxID=171383 RepID=UPI001C08416F|nr:hypothetical protein [Vibrio hepatarius]MBU2895100.1 hypothetical protein [Vibrio hepatarius]